MLRAGNREALRYEVVSVLAQSDISRVSQRREAWGVCYRTLSALGILVSEGIKESRGPRFHWCLDGARDPFSRKAQSI